MSKKDVSAIVSGAGLLTSIFSALVEEVKKLGGNDESIHRLSRPEGRELIVKIAKLLVANIGEVYPLDVFGHSINDLVKQGNYDWSDWDIKDANFQSDEMHQNEVILKDFGKCMITEAVLKALDVDGLRPATISELLEFGIRYPEAQKQFPIVALGSMHQNSRGSHRVGCLFYRDGRRELGLRYPSDGWTSSYRFAAVRK